MYSGLQTLEVMAAEMTVSGLPLWQGEGILIVSLELETVEESFN